MDRNIRPTKIIYLSPSKAREVLLGNDCFTTIDLPAYFDFSAILRHAAKCVGKKSLDECTVPGCNPERLAGVNLDVITNKDGHYGVRPLTIPNPYLYYMMVRDICSPKAWKSLRECFRLYAHPHIQACAIPVVNISDSPEPFTAATTILNWWERIEQQSIELSLRYRYMFITDITNCFGQINPESIAWALARKDTPHATDSNASLAAAIQRYLRAMQQGRNIGVPQGSTLFSLIGEIILGYADMLLARDIAAAQERGVLPAGLEYEVLRYVDDYRIFCNDRDALDHISYLLQHILESLNFRMNTSKTRTTSQIITDSIKPDKAFYIFNTPIESKQPYLDADGKEQRRRTYDFDGFQKHLLFIHEFSRRFPDSGQLVRQLEEFSHRLEEHLKPREVTYSETIVDFDNGGKRTTELVTCELPGQIVENIPVMVAICTDIAACNLRAARNALKVASQLLAAMPRKMGAKKKEVIGLMYRKLIRIPNSGFIQVWLQNITHTSDDWSATPSPYDMPLCRLVARQPVSLWDNSWLLPSLTEAFPQDSIIDRKALSATGQILATRYRPFADPYYGA